MSEPYMFREIFNAEIDCIKSGNALTPIEQEVGLKVAENLRIRLVSILPDLLRSVVPERLENNHYQKYQDGWNDCCDEITRRMGEII